MKLFLVSVLVLSLGACTPSEQATGAKVFDVVRKVRDLVCDGTLPTASPAPSASAAPPVAPSASGK